MLLVENIAVPLLIAILGMGVSWFVSDVFLKIIKLDYFVIKLIIFLVIWHFFGGVLYKFICSAITSEPYKFFEILYNPIRMLISLF